MILKIIDDRKHKLFTGSSNKQILENDACLGSSGIPTWIRVPIIPGYTDNEEDIAAAAHRAIPYTYLKPRSKRNISSVQNKFISGIAAVK